MSLVAYDASSSDESETEENEDIASKVIIPNGVANNAKTYQPPIEPPPAVQNNPTTQTNTEVSTPSEQNGLFTALPQPKHQVNNEIIEEQDEFLMKKAVPEIPKPEKKSKQPVKIGVPALSQYDSDDDDEPKSKKIKSAAKASGLFALLPAPKLTPVTTKSFVPNVLTRKKPIASSKPIKPTSSIKPKVNEDVAIPKSGNTKTGESNNSDDSDDDIDVPETFDEETWQKVCGQQKPARKPIIEETVQPEFNQPIEIAPEPTKPYTGLDNEGFKQLVGKMRKPENVQVIDINEEDILPDKDQWMIKSLTDPTQAPKYVVKDPVNDTCKRKHHITYLAQQAKANEQDLQNQWAANRFTRKQTQSKYGF